MVLCLCLTDVAHYEASDILVLNRVCGWERVTSGAVDFGEFGGVFVPDDHVCGVQGFHEGEGTLVNATSYMTHRCEVFPVFEDNGDWVLRISLVSLRDEIDSLTSRELHIRAVTD